MLDCRYSYGVIIVSTPERGEPGENDRGGEVDGHHAFDNQEIDKERPNTTGLCDVFSTGKG